MVQQFHGLGKVPGLALYSSLRVSFERFHGVGSTLSGEERLAEACNRAPALAEPMPQRSGQLVHSARQTLAVLRHLAEGGNRGSICATHSFRRQQELLAGLGNGSAQNCLASSPLTNIPRNRGCQLGIRLERHHSKGLADSCVGNECYIGALGQPGTESCVECLVERGVAGTALEAGNDYLHRRTAGMVLIPLPSQPSSHTQ